MKILRAIGVDFLRNRTKKNNKMKFYKLIKNTGAARSLKSRVEDSPIKMTGVLWLKFVNWYRLVLGCFI